jgi:outer membrane protein OmpA-like peptidoglycan-associated protein
MPLIIPSAYSGTQTSITTYAQASTSAYVSTVDGGARRAASEVLTKAGPQNGTSLVQRVVSKNPPKAKWTKDEDKRFHYLTGRKALRKDFGEGERLEFLQLRQRRRKLLLRISAEQELFDLKDRELRAKARAALQEYFEFLESKNQA